MLLEQNGIIERTSLGWGGGAPVLTAHLHLKFDGTGQAFGGYTHDTPIFDETGKFLRREGTAWGMEWIGRVLTTLEIEEWGQLPGTIVRVRRVSHWGLITALGHAYKDRWFSPETDLAYLIGKETSK